MNEKRYIQEIKVVETYLEDLIGLTLLLLKLSENNNYYEVSLFIRMSMIPLSVYKLVPKTMKSKSHIIVDVSSVAALVRCFIDSYELLHFICEATNDIDEYKFRIEIVNYHCLSEESKIVLNMSHSTDQRTLYENYYGRQKEKYKKKLVASAYFKQLTKKVQNKILRGELVCFLTRAQISNANNADSNKLAINYKILSNHTHAHPLALKSLIDRLTLFDGKESRRSLCFMLYIMNYYVGLAIIAIMKFDNEVEKLIISKNLYEKSLKLIKRFSNETFRNEF